MSGITGWRLAVLAFLLCCVSASTRHSSRQHIGPASAQCESVRLQFTSARIGPANLVPQSPQHDAAMDICYKGKENPHKQSCCTRKTERKYLQAAEKDFYEVIRSTSSYLKNLLTANSVQYQETILSLISQAENSTSILFTEVHKIPVREHQGPLQALFVDLTAFIKRRQVNLHDSVTSFFDELFPVFWQNILQDPSSLDLTEDYKECLMEVRQSLSPRPFGEVPHRLSHQLTRAMSAAKSFLEALSLGIETINRTDHLALEPQCTHALTRLRYCGHCDGYVEARPCRNFCYNVMRGCLATVSEIDRHWNGYVDAVKALTSTMRGSFSVESVLNSLHTRISEAILHALETGHKFNEQVKEKCGQPQASHSSTGAVPASPQVDPANVKVTTPEGHTKAHLYSRMETFMRSLLASKGFYRSLADTICSAEKFATGLDQDRCWNGHSLGKYNRTLVEVALDDQMKNNPEMEVAQRQSTIIVGLIDKLIQIKKSLQAKTHTETMQSDSFAYN